MPWQTYSSWENEGSNKGDVKMNSSHSAKTKVEETKGRKANKESEGEKIAKVGNDGLLVDFAKLSSTGEVLTFTPEEARKNATKELNTIVDLTRFLEKEGIPCCLVAECALLHYNSRASTIYDWIMCVPESQHDKAKALINSRPGMYKAIVPRIPFQTDRMHHLFPRYRCIASDIFFVLTTSQASHIQCVPENIVHSPMGLPYPKLPIFAQSLIDTQNATDLADLVDSQGLSLEWGRQNLALEGDVDLDWANWRIQRLDEAGCEIVDWRNNATSRRVLWENAVKGKRARLDAKAKERAEMERWKASEQGRAAGEAMLRGDLERCEALYEEYKQLHSLD